eukprot:3762882-Alexandrium_andersonii.AAC.1
MQFRHRPKLVGATSGSFGRLRALLWQFRDKPESAFMALLGEARNCPEERKSTPEHARNCSE